MPYRDRFFIILRSVNKKLIMKRVLLGLISVLLLMSSILSGQDNLSISESRKKNLRSILDYRYKGGYYSFERLFNKTVEYPEIAIQNCILGIVVASFEVDCEGVIQKITLKNIMKFGIDQQVTNFFYETEGNWNTCDDKKYTRFDVPIQFTLEDTETNTEDAILIVEKSSIGFDCNDDKYYLDRAKKNLDKGKGKKALSYINVLIQRNPYNHEYMEMRTKAISLIK